jgi:uncharacterized membrane protein
MDENEMPGVDQQPPDPDPKPSDYVSMGTLIALGSALGMLFGTMMQNLVWGLIIGAALGTVAGAIYESQRAKP